MSKLKLLLISIFIFGALLRLTNLSADPSILLDSGQAGDEGYWLYNARNLATFGQTAKDDFYHDFAAAPLFSMGAYLSFWLFGVGFLQARLVSALAGILTLIFIYLIGKKISVKVATIATFLVSINTMLLLHNRLAVGESLAIMFATMGFYFISNRNGLVVAGLSFALSLLSKTTSFIYLPSMFLILITDFRKSAVTTSRIAKFLVPFIFLFLIIFGGFYLKWRQQIVLIYSTFGAWYAPKTFSEIWQNALNFFLHPFWGSPFLFSLLILAIINAVNFIIDVKSRTGQRRFLLLWMAGIFVLGPFISKLSNARMLGLIVPIAILGSQTVMDRKIRKYDIRKISRILVRSKLFFPFVALGVNVPIALIVSKLILAVIKRILADPIVVYKLPFVVIFVLLAFWIITYKNRHFLEKILIFDVYLLIFAPIASFIPLFWNYLNFFDLARKPATTVVSVITVIAFIFYYFVMKKPSKVNLLVVPLLVTYIFFNIFGIATIIYKPTYRFKNAASTLGEIIDRKSFVGFYGHELAIGNKSWPIYWAPRLDFVGGVNANWQKFDPKFLLVTQIFDSIPGSPESWPDEKSIDRKLYYVTTLDLTRNFLLAKREFKINVYQIAN